MNNKQLKFNTGKYKGKTYLEIINNTEDLKNIINSNSPGIINLRHGRKIISTKKRKKKNQSKEIE